MNANDTITDLAGRVTWSLAQLRELSPAELNAHPLGHPNSPGWLLWHTGRELDLQLAHLRESEEVWTTQGFRDRFDLGEIGDSLGYGHTPEEAASIQVANQGLAAEYIEACVEAVLDHARTVPEDAWDEVIDEYDGEPVTRQVRVTSILIDALEHLAQAIYVAGMPDLDQ